MENENQPNFGQANPHAPQALSQFAFLIGKWKGKGRSQNKEGGFDNYEMIWEGRYILNGYAIADKALIQGKEGNWDAIFTSYRFYDEARQQWVIEAHNILASTLVQQLPNDLGGLHIDGGTIYHHTRGAHYITRENYLNISEDHFTYRMDVSSDNGKSWMKGVDIIEANRVKP